MSNLVVIGGVTLDSTCSVRDAKADFTLADSLCESLGGMAYNTAIASSQLGTRTKLLASAGPDLPPIKNRRNLVYDFCESATPTSHCFMFHDGEKERICFYPGSYNEIDENRAKRAIEQADWVHFAGVCPVFEELVNFSDTESKIISACPGYDIHHNDPKSSILRELVQKSDYLILNTDEAKHLGLPLDSIVNAGVIVTMGKNGSVLVEKEGRTQVKAYEVEVKSPFGAGDVFVGTFIAAMASDEAKNDATIATKLASAAASFAVEQETTIPELNWDEIKKRAKKL